MIANLKKEQKEVLFDILCKYDKLYPSLGDSLSKTVQGIEDKSDIILIDEFICSNDLLDKEDKLVLDKLFASVVLEIFF